MTPEDVASLDVNSDGIAVLRMHDQASGNGLSEPMVRALDSLLSTVAVRDDVKVMMLAGLPEYFSTGATADVLRDLASSRIEPADLVLPRRVLDVPVPTLGVMEGHALGGGLALGICCDIVLIARESRYGCPFMNYGFTPGMGTTRLLEHVVSPAIAHEMLLTGEPMKGSRFEGCGGFNYVLPRQDVWPKALDVAGRIADKPRASLVLLKAHLVAGRRQIYEGTRHAEADMHRQTFATPDVLARILESSS